MIIFRIITTDENGGAHPLRISAQNQFNFNVLKITSSGPGRAPRLFQKDSSKNCPFKSPDSALKSQQVSISCAIVPLSFTAKAMTANSDSIARTIVDSRHPAHPVVVSS